MGRRDGSRRYSPIGESWHRQAGAEFDHVEVRNAVAGISANADIAVKNSLIEDCDYFGLSVEGVDSVYVGNTTIRDIGFAGVDVHGGTSLRLSRCEIDNVDFYGAKAYTGAHLYADTTLVGNCDTGIYIHFEDSLYTRADIDTCTLKHNDTLAGEVDDSKVVAASTMRRPVAVGDNRSVRIDVTDAVTRFMRNPSENHGLVIGSLRGRRDGLFELKNSGGALARMLLPFKLGLGGPLGNGRQYVSWIALEDLVGVEIPVHGRPQLRKIAGRSQHALIVLGQHEQRPRVGEPEVLQHREYLARLLLLNRKLRQDRDLLVLRLQRQRGAKREMPDLLRDVEPIAARTRPERATCRTR